MKWQAFRLTPAEGERKTKFEEEEVNAWIWLMRRPDRPQLEEVPDSCRKGATLRPVFVGQRCHPVRPAPRVPAAQKILPAEGKVRYPCHGIIFQPCRCQKIPKRQV